ncbi:MAG TPA: DUF4956 domain-containing protein [Symbiobacteriaceae bacterium]|nr:DUF4956 domain-containing protein [Symbiobacteriaceae bacterium]
MNETLNFSDLFKKGFLSAASQDLNLGRILVSLGLAFALGLFLYIVYKRTFRGVLYSRSFNLSLIAITMVTALIIVAVTSNVVLSLGMVGALSIVRFRTAVKDPMDLVFLFWAIAIGIVTGAGLYMLGLVGSLVIGLVLFLLSRAPASETPYLLVVHAANDNADAAIRTALTASGQRCSVKSKTISPAGVEATYEVRLKDGASTLVNQIAAMQGVESAVLIAYNGDYAA